MNKLQVFLAVLLILLSATSFAQDESGGYVGVFLDIPVAARPTAMGGAYTSISDDPAGQLHNPAGLQSNRSYMFNSSFRSMKLDRSLGFVSITLPTKLESSLGVSWLFAGYGELEGRDNTGFPTAQILSSSEHMFGVTFAKRFMPYLAIGAKVNYFHKDHVGLTASSIGINVGAMLYVDSLFRYGTMESKPITDITGGLTVTNIAAKYPWAVEGDGLQPSSEDKFATDINIGFSFRALKRKLLTAIDFVNNIKYYNHSETPDETITVHELSLRAGTEYLFNDLYALRAGINDGTFTAGAGFGFEMEQLRININYAFSADKSNAGEDHIFSLDLNF